MFISQGINICINYMGNLGDFFPNDVKENSIINLLIPGSVIKLLAKETKPKPKKKRFIVIGKDNNNNFIGVVYINSEINFNVINNPELLRLQHKIEKSDNDFLDWESSVDCSKIVILSYELVKKEMLEDISNILGNVKTIDLEKIVELVKSSTNISPKELKSVGL